MSLFGCEFKRLLYQILYKYKCSPPCLFPNYTHTTDPIQVWSPRLSGVRLWRGCQWLPLTCTPQQTNFILSKQHRSPATESRNPGAPGLNQECRLLLIPWSTSSNFDLHYHWAQLSYKNKHYNKSSIYDRMKFKIKLNQIWFLSVWVGSSMRYFYI